MLVGVVSAPDPRWTSEQQVRACGLVPSLPGWKWIWRLNWERYSDLSWYDLPSPSPPTSNCLRLPPPPLRLLRLPLCFFRLRFAPTLMRTCTAHTTTSCPLSD